MTTDEFSIRISLHQAKNLAWKMARLYRDIGRLPPDDAVAMRISRDFTKLRQELEKLALENGYAGT